MSGHLTEKIIKLFLERKLDQSEIVATARHIAVCDDCRQKLSEARDISASVRYLDATLQSVIALQNHLSYEQLEAYIDESLKQSENEKVKRHLADCAACAKEANELSLLRDNLSVYPNTVQSVSAVVIHEDSVWQKLIAFLQIKPLQIAGLAIVVLLFATTVIFVYRITKKPVELANTSNSNQTQVANTNATPSVNNNQKDTKAQTVNSNQESDKTDEKKNTNINSEESRTPLVTKNNQKEQLIFSAYNDVVRKALSRQEIVLPYVVNELKGRESRLMGSKDSQEKFDLVSPYGTVVQTSRPTFRWQPLEGAKSYTVYLLNSNFEVVEKSGKLTNESWTTTRKLKRGQTFVWQVVAYKDGKEIASPVSPAREARFKVLDRKKFLNLKRFAQSEKNNHLTLGIIYAHLGLLDDAERELEFAIQKQQSPLLAKKLLQNFNAVRH